MNIIYIHIHTYIYIYSICIHGITCTHIYSYHCCLASIRVNKTVFSSFLKLASELLLQRNSTGRLLQELGPDTANAWLSWCCMLVPPTFLMPLSAVVPTSNRWNLSAMPGKISRSQSIQAPEDGNTQFVIDSGPDIKPVQTSFHFDGDMAIPRFFKYEASRCPHNTLHLVEQCGRCSAKKSVAVIKSGQD